ncbi:MAG: cyclic nucleotide-binding protein [Methylococcaceae bacterium TMED69]|nr:MAG: cyclic nucleotide-binding protein [Methylococcaceae bacterium TMED69]
MAEHFNIIIIGGGPGGLSATARAAEMGESHLLLEASPNIANTISKFQKGKHVMAEPAVLPIRSKIAFEAGTRETILDTWTENITAINANLKFNSEVQKIERDGNVFRIGTKDSQYTADNIVLSIGIQGNVRKLGVTGEDLEFVQYQLDDPDEYVDETIVVVGAGDAAIENALALSKNNKVIILNRRDEFARAKEGNLSAILSAIEKGVIECIYNANASKVTNIDKGEGSEHRLCFEVATKEESIEIECDRIIARLGALPPRKFLESCGIEFASDEPNSVPSVSGKYESNVKGLFIIGSLAGYPLIKQCVNQGYEVIEFICGRDVEPADESLLWDKIKCIPNVKNVNEGIEVIRSEVPTFSSLTPLQLREFLLDSDIYEADLGQTLIEYNDYTNTFFSIISGEVDIRLTPDDPNDTVSIGSGNFFGEMSLISGRRRSATITAGKNCIVIETPRRSMNKLINSVESVKRVINDTFISRAIKMHLAPGLDDEEISEVIASATLSEFKPNEIIFSEGDAGDSLHLIRSGSVTVSKIIGDKTTTLAYLPAGNYFGEMALLNDAPRSATIKTAVATETIVLQGKEFRRLLSKNPETKKKLEALSEARSLSNTTKKSGQGTDIVEFMMEQGLGEATDVLLIDESLCVRCDHCEKACAGTHGGSSMLDREAGPTVAGLHVPTSCRHCEHPHCMKDCPPDAIHRTADGEVYIADNCIGCGNCVRNCPYGVIQMAAIRKEPATPLWKQIIFGFDPYPETQDKDAPKKAVKCDMCKDLAGGPACVRACPTGAAIRVSPEEFITMKLQN